MVMVMRTTFAPCSSAKMINGSQAESSEAELLHGGEDGFTEVTRVDDLIYLRAY